MAAAGLVLGGANLANLAPELKTPNGFKFRVFSFTGVLAWASSSSSSHPKAKPATTPAKTHTLPDSHPHARSSVEQPKRYLIDVNF